MRMTRLATAADLDAIAALTTASRRRLATWSPLWWRQAESSDDLHRMWLQQLIEGDGPVVRVVTEHSHVIACAVSRPQPTQWFVDDVAVADDDRWADAGIELMATIAERPALTCVPTQHLARRAASEAAHLQHASSYWILRTTPVAGTTADPIDPSIVLPSPPPHTFGGALDPHAPGGLTVGSSSGGALVGSASMTAPPVYDPGGTVCVVDRVTGDPAPLLERALQLSGARGDVLMTVVAGIHDNRLISGLKELEFERTVDVFTWPASGARR